MNKTLILFTTAYPYQGGEQFLETEIEYLANHFDKIIIIPAKNNNTLRKVPDNVYIDNFVAGANKSYFNRIKSTISRDFFNNITVDLSSNRYLAIHMFYIKKYKQWIRHFLKTEELDKCLFYTYWFSASTTALSLVKNDVPTLKFVTRVHGGDLYENLHGFKEFPTRKKVIKNINKIFTISDNGKSHLELKYPIPKNKITTSRLGIKPHGFLSTASVDGKLRIVSCSSLIPVKRVHLIVEALEYLNGNDVEIIWTHIGDGKLRQAIEDQAKRTLGKNIAYNFLGVLPNNEVYAFYRDNPVDLFLNVSSSEGVPVSIMEAQSFSIPVIATDVGGNSEIVNDNNGSLLSASPSAKEIAKVLLYCYHNKENWNIKRKKSFDNWKHKYNANNNYLQFTKEIIRL